MSSKQSEDIKAADIYTAQEIIAGYASFGVPKEIVMAAMKTYRVKTATSDEAAKLIKKYSEMEVK